ncbi:hypothetical protein Tco_1397768 [Tanacetum coccineum]
MATEPNESRKETSRRLRQEFVADVELTNNLLHELNRYLEQLRTRAPELLRVEMLPDDPDQVRFQCSRKGELFGYGKLGKPGFNSDQIAANHYRQATND